MSLDATRWAWMQQIGGPPGVKLVLLSLADRADEYHRCYPSIARLVKDTGMHRDTVFAAIERLEKARLLTVDRRNGAGNVYTLIGVDSRENQSEKSDQSEKPDPSEISAYQSEKSDLNQSEKSDPEPTIESTNNLRPPPIGAPPAKKPRQLPDDFTLTTVLRSRAETYWASKQRTDLDVDDEFVMFTAHHRSRGTRAVVWEDAWTTWYGNAVRFNRKPPENPRASNRPDRNPSEDRSAAGRVRANVARARAERAAAEADRNRVAADGLDVRSPLDVEFWRHG